MLVIKVGQLTNAAIAAHIRKKRYHVTDSLMTMLIGSHSDAIGKKSRWDHYLAYSGGRWILRIHRKPAMPLKNSSLSI